MSKGTKQIRLGRVEKVLKELEQRFRVLEEVQANNEKYSRFTEGQMYELDCAIQAIKKEFEL